MSDIIPYQSAGFIGFLLLVITYFYLIPGHLEVSPLYTAPLIKQHYFKFYGSIQTGLSQSHSP